jgi:hypothetical protein
VARHVISGRRAKTGPTAMHARHATTAGRAPTGAIGLPARHATTVPHVRTGATATHAHRVTKDGHARTGVIAHRDRATSDLVMIDRRARTGAIGARVVRATAVGVMSADPVRSGATARRRLVPTGAIASEVAARLATRTNGFQSRADRHAKTTGVPRDIVTTVPIRANAAATGAIALVPVINGKANRPAGNRRGRAASRSVRRRRVTPDRADSADVNPPVHRVAAATTTTSMIAHVVLFRPKADLTSDQRRAFMVALEHALTNIPTIKQARVGRRVLLGRQYDTLNAHDFPFVAMMEFANEADLRAYLEHPAHEMLGAQFYVTSDAALVFDYELLEGDAIRSLV